MTANPAARPYRVLRDTATNWFNDIVWLMPHHVRDYHVPVTELPKPAAQTTRDAAVPSHPERINDWPGSDASGEGTSIWHPDGNQQPPPEIPEMTDEQMAALQEFMRPIRDLAIHELERAKQPIPVMPTTRSILAQQTAEAEAARQADPLPDGAPDPLAPPLETRHYADGTSSTGTAPLPEHSPDGAETVSVEPEPHA